MSKDLLFRPELTEVVRHFENACLASRQWDANYREALMRYGSHGPQVSGCGRDHFPDDVKAALRKLARSVADASDAALQARPARVHINTIRAVGRAVAARDGTGFYGAQP